MISTRDPFTSSSGGSAVRWLRSRLGHPTAEDLAAAADSLEVETVEHLQSSATASLSGLLERWPEALGEPALIDTILDVAVEWYVNERGMARDTALDKLRAANPNLSPQIELCRVLSDAIGASVTGSTGPERADASPKLPAEMGPVLADGRRRYELRQLLGDGSQGRVYLAVDRALSDSDRPAWVAVKLARTASPMAAQRLIDEATKVRRVEHPNVVRVFDAGITGADQTYLVTEYVDAGTLERLRCESSDNGAVRKAVATLSGVCRGVQAIHAQGLVHCDLKPTNVLLTGAGVPKVADFGLSVRRWSGGKSDEPALPVGNLAFMAPEQFRHPERPASPPGDLYALGGLLLWIITGRSPNGSTGSEVATRLTSDDTAALEGELARIPSEDLRAIARKALSSNPTDRYSSADALAADMDRWLAHEPLAWRQGSSWHRVRMFARREPVLTRIAAGAALIVLGTGIAGGVLVTNAERRRAQSDADAAKATVVADRATANQRIADAAITARQNFDAEHRKALALFRQVMRGSMEIPEQWLPILTILEVVGGPVLFGGTGQDELNVWRDRIPVGVEVIARLEQRAGGMTIESAGWRMCTAYWKLRTDDPAGGRAIARETLGRWNDRGLPQGDPLARKVALIEALCDGAEAATAAPGRVAEIRETVRALAEEIKDDYRLDALTTFAFAWATPPAPPTPAPTGGPAGAPTGSGR